MGKKGRKDGRKGKERREEWNKRKTEKKGKEIRKDSVVEQAKKTRQVGKQVYR